MEESGGRRIKRSVSIDLNSICFSTPEMVEKFSRIEFLKDYVAEKQKELQQYNREHGVDESSPVNGRRMTNIGTFRAYLVQYIQADIFDHVLAALPEFWFPADRDSGEAVMNSLCRSSRFSASHWPVG